ncbi:hypothetical protein FIBSPDRAFT_924411 [Athelia psychrophila]|uniref:Uncharacterized protein n=1 Tax=Athelia psychrophila TaxID=1759441 RepID=A0A166W4Y4_9AGAM|nr:hypothetical protein FIBSPDRAFT_924411 [Fibularhizoctonia sp. CBS 109695]
MLPALSMIQLAASILEICLVTSVQALYTMRLWMLSEWRPHTGAVISTLATTVGFGFNLFITVARSQLHVDQTERSKIQAGFYLAFSAVLVTEVIIAASVCLKLQEFKKKQTPTINIIVVIILVSKDKLRITFILWKLILKPTVFRHSRNEMLNGRQSLRQVPDIELAQVTDTPVQNSTSTALATLTIAISDGWFARPDRPTMHKYSKP